MGTVAGGQQFGGEILVDGNSLDTISGNNADVINEVPSIEGIQEFTELSTGMSAEYGRSTNGILNLTTKSGTNNFHGRLMTSFATRISMPIVGSITIIWERIVSAPMTAQHANRISRYR